MTDLEKATDLLRDLNELVWSCTPWLLNEDSGASRSDVELSIEIEEFLRKYPDQK